MSLQKALEVVVTIDHDVYDEGERRTHRRIELASAGKNHWALRVSPGRPARTRKEREPWQRQHSQSK
jgi:hypothetical protein